MWQVIEQAISNAVGQRYHITEKKSVHGGDINKTFKISDGLTPYFVKINDKHYYELLEAEAYSLEKIQDTQQIHCPEVITLGCSSKHSFLVLSHLSLTPNQVNNWYQLGQQLALFHQHTASETNGAKEFGWQHDNFIGKTYQPNRWHKKWRVFFAEQRIAWQLQLLQEKSISLGNIDYIGQICHDLLGQHKSVPCMVHGDLWQGNLGFDSDIPTVFDPASYYGDREVDLAMTELFGSLPREFYRGYQDQYPLDQGYEERKLIYNFYHILNHANLFGGIYIDQAKAMLARIVANYRYCYA